MKRFNVGIDLGTTNTVVAYAESDSDEIRLFDIEQLVGPGEIKALPFLPSLRFHAARGELPASALELPWTEGKPAEQEPVVFGMFARRLGAQVPGRLVASAKSWLSHTAVDRLAPILPWGAGDDVLKVSPMEASASYLAYLRAAWNWRFPDAPLEEQDIVLTVPASFDEGARALTVEAAKQAGLAQLRLLEEPQAAFYDWLHAHRSQLTQQLAQTRLVLICDVGGGTTDLSLIKVTCEANQPQLTRVGVGKHLMLGGDNMDLVLANLVEARINGGQPDAQQGPRRLSATELSQLIERCRSAKEELLAVDAASRTSVTLVGTGSRLIGGMRTAELTRDEVERIIVDGFFPLVSQNDKVMQRRSGIVEFGLPYASDPAITRHLASFLAQHADVASGDVSKSDSVPGSPLPDTLLLNGGVFHSRALTGRLEHILGLWRGQPLRVLHNRHPDAAVARGAVAYALAIKGIGAKIGGGSARSYFLVLDEGAKVRRRIAGSDDEPGITPAETEAIAAVCIFPRGSEEGKEILLRERIFALRLNQPVRFHLVSSTDDRGQPPPSLGDLLELPVNDVVRLPPIATVLHSKSTAHKQEMAVQLATSLTEVGTLELHCVSKEDASQRWLLEFQLRADKDDVVNGSGRGADSPLPVRFDQALAAIDRIFGSRAQKVDAKEVRQLRAQLEKLIGNREQWTMPLLRKLFDELWQRARGRRRSVQHEKVWFNLIGFCLRPGFGYPLDDWRMRQLWCIFEAGPQYLHDSQVATEWWTMWRRVAGGLEKEAQLRLLDDFAFNVQADEEEQQKPPSHLVRGSMEDMLRLAGSIERIPASYKAEIGNWLLDLLNKSTSGSASSLSSEGSILWSLARVGARQPFYGNAHDVVPPEVAVAWIESLMALDWKRAPGAPLTAAHLARFTGDRARDLPEEIRDRLVTRLQSIGAPATWIAMVHGKVELDEVSRKGFLGDSLPPGLKLLY